ncbi:MULTISPECIES: TenA family transcriptional regulator [Brevibacillus]|jgi:pyrroloquinoline quinone (PQQ) biosynthesis protein C|uniref:TenA family transcriptional regulator n=1 Tax=Brevibacillus TaxID=55080 RepID=UPI001491FA23|nr:MULTISPECIES: iron-containing redox enzyme family protein [Brevibacillus]MBR8658477.1 iron-containing redox enzyme family protein [Brevibacillus sp. NL20B1]MDT3415454.1 pyrroloquinoline quinone (PQQ) biosynthesis protein C [Brevibacillus aydinogluensis]
MTNAYTEVKQLAEQLFARHQVERHPLFLALHDRSFSPAQAKEAALQIYHVVEHFPRFLSAILTNLPDYRLRMPLVDNLYEEHGRMNEAHVHLETYKRFLRGIGVTDAERDVSRPIIPVLAYNRAITDLCLHYPFPEGLAALGVIEEIVARVSPLVGAYAASAYGNAADLAHFTDHEILDVTHANEIYEVVAQVYSGDNKPLVERGMQLGMYYHTRLYTDILDHVQSFAAHL